MLFGVPADFAIEAGVEPDLVPPTGVWGHMCIWCRGVPLGDITLRSCGLGPAYNLFRWLASHLDDLWDLELDGLNDGEVWNFLDGLLYGWHGDEKVQDDRSAEQCRADSAAWNQFTFLTNEGEQFDGFKSFILCPPGSRVRILSRRFPAPMGLRVEVSREAFIGASEGFTRWFEEQQSRLRGRES